MLNGARYGRCKSGWPVHYVMWERPSQPALHLITLGLPYLLHIEPLLLKDRVWIGNRSKEGLRVPSLYGVDGCLNLGPLSE